MANNYESTMPLWNFLFLGGNEQKYHWRMAGYYLNVTYNVLKYSTPHTNFLYYYFFREGLDLTYNLEYGSKEMYIIAKNNVLSALKTKKVKEKQLLCF